MNILTHKQIQADDDIRVICRQIVEEGKNNNEWDEIESDDMFQSGPYVGGYDATEQEFWFSYYDPDGIEYWFGFSLEIATKIALGDEYYFDIRKAEWNPCTETNNTSEQDASCNPLPAAVLAATILIWTSTSSSSSAQAGSGCTSSTFAQNEYLDA